MCLRLGFSVYGRECRSFGVWSFALLGAQGLGWFTGPRGAEGLGVRACWGRMV